MVLTRPKPFPPTFNRSVAIVPTTVKFDQVGLDVPIPTFPVAVIFKYSLLLTQRLRYVPFLRTNHPSRCLLSDIKIIWNRHPHHCYCLCLKQEKTFIQQEYHSGVMHHEISPQLIYFRSPLIYNLDSLFQSLHSLQYTQ